MTYDRMSFVHWNRANRRAADALPLNTSQLNVEFPDRKRLPSLPDATERIRARHALNEAGACVTCSLLDRAADLVPCTHGGPFARCLDAATTTTPGADSPPG